MEHLKTKKNDSDNNPFLFLDVDIWSGLYTPKRDGTFIFIDAGGILTLDTLPFGERKCFL